MLRIYRTTAEDKDFIDLVKYLDADLAISDGDEHSFYDQFNKIDSINHVIVLYYNDEPIGCGAIKKYEAKTMEIKRMYTLPQFRGRGYATRILQELEKWAAEMSYKKCILETGKKQPEAIKLYRKNGYEVISNYGQYANVENSLCFEKQIVI